MSFAVSSAAAPLRSTQYTCAPSRANVTAAALPLPQPGPIEPAPTTIATLPLSRSIARSPVLFFFVARLAVTGRPYWQALLKRHVQALGDVGTEAGGDDDAAAHLLRLDVGGPH